MLKLISAYNQYLRGKEKWLNYLITENFMVLITKSIITKSL